MLVSEFTPACEPGSQRLMVVLHGLGDSLDGYRWLPGELALPGLNYLLVNAPDPYYGGYSWFDVFGEPGPGVRRSRALLAELLDTQAGNGCPTEQTALFGFSQGCTMVLEAAARYPRRFAGVIGVSGFVHELEALVRELSPIAGQQRLLITHGTADPLIPIAPVREQITRLQAAGMQIEWREFAKAHTIAGAAELAVIRAFVQAGWGHSR